MRYLKGLELCQNKPEIKYMDFLIIVDDFYCFIIVFVFLNSLTLKKKKKDSLNLHIFLKVSCCNQFILATIK